MQETYINPNQFREYLTNRIRKTLPYVQLTQGFVNLCWLIAFWIVVPYADKNTCPGPIYLFSKIAQYIHIFLAGWNISSIPIGYRLAKKARNDPNPQNRRPPKWLFSIWRFYHVVSFFLWLYGLTALLNIRRCANSTLALMAVTYVVLPVILATIWICSVACWPRGRDGAPQARPNRQSYEMVGQTV